MLQFDQLSSNLCTLAYHGSIENVLKGRLPPECAERWIDAKAMRYGFMSGSPKGLSSLGEVVVANGMAYGKSTDISDHRFFDVIVGERFLSTALLAIPNDTEPSLQAKWEGHPLACSKLYKELYSHVKRPFAFAGLVSFEKMHGTAITKPPIEGDEIFADKETYWSVPPKIEEGGTGLLVGVVADFQDSQFAGLHQQMEVALYSNPYDTSAELAAHCHVLTLQDEIHTIEELKPPMVDDVLHLLSDTQLTSLELEIYPIERLAPLLAEVSR